MIKREISDQIQSRMFGGKAIVIMGARQTGKTTLVAELLRGRDDVCFLNGDDADTRAFFRDANIGALRRAVGDRRVVVVDEAQRIRDIGIKLKLITDQMKDVQLIATGSSSFDLANEIHEPLTGRYWEYRLYPLSFSELAATHGLLEEKRGLNERLIFGSYPEVVANGTDAREILRTLASSYLYRDILAFAKIRHSDRLERLLRALALQIGSQVSYSELAGLTGLDAKTVESYIDILEKSYIVFRLGSYSRNLRNELKFSRKIYFYDNGIRNAVISNFAPIDSRTDAGALWENYAVAERIKANEYRRRHCGMYFWRTVNQAEIDLVEDADGRLSTFEFKFGKRRANPPKSFVAAYPGSTFQVVSPDNLDAFLSPEWSY